MLQQSSLHRVFIICLVAGLSLTGAHADRLPHAVLIVDQSGPGVTIFNQIAQAFRSNLNVQADPALTIYHEKLDLNVFADPGYLRLLENFVHEKYRDRAIGVMVALGAKGLQWAISLRERRGAEIPIVFAAISNQAVQFSELPSNITGRTTEQSFEDYVKVARALVPQMKQLALVGDPLEGQGFRRHMKREIPSATRGLELNDITGLPVRTVKERVANLPADSAIVYTAIYVDGDGKVITPKEGLEIITQTANRPIVVDVESYIGLGATGGIMMRPEIVGRETADLVTRVFDEDSAAHIPVSVSNAMQPVFSWPELRRWGVDERRLPPGSDIRFRSPDMWERYRWQVALFMAAFLLQSFLILAFLYEDRRRRVAEAESVQLRSELLHLDRVATAGEMSASIAHEIRQPLAAIVAFGTAGLRWLTRSEPDLPEARKALRTIVDEGHRAGQVIENVRAMLRHNVEPRTAIDARDLIRKTLALIAGDIKKNDIVVALELDEAGPLQIYGNEVQLRQVMVNLITNAIDAMKTVADRPRVLRIRAQPANPGAILIVVEDSGPGIDPRNMGKLFDSFFSTKPNGMGLGLSICKSIVEAHDGRLTAASAGQYGAIFRIVLPSSERAVT